MSGDARRYRVEAVELQLFGHGPRPLPWTKIRIGPGAGRTATRGLDGLGHSPTAQGSACRQRDADPALNAHLLHSPLAEAKADPSRV